MNLTATDFTGEMAYSNITAFAEPPPWPIGVPVNPIPILLEAIVGRMILAALVGLLAYERRRN